MWVQISSILLRFLMMPRSIGHSELKDFEPMVLISQPSFGVYLDEKPPLHSYSPWSLPTAAISSVICFSTSEVISLKMHKCLNATLPTCSRFFLIESKMRNWLIMKNNVKRSTNTGLCNFLFERIQLVEYQDWKCKPFLSKFLYYVCKDLYQRNA